MINLKEKYKSGIHYFYRIDNLINGKFYYGIRTCHCLPGQDPYMGSGSRLHRAFNKYGMSSFKKIVLRVLPTREDVSDLERWIVTEELVKDPMCYNEKVGGDDTNSFYGKVFCIDTLIGDYVMISKDLYYSNKDRYKSYNSMTIKGKFYAKVIGTNENKLISVDEYYSNKDAYSTQFPSRKGMPMPESTKRKIGEANKSLTGSKNPMYGTHRIWINNGVIRKRINPEDLDEYMNSGKWKLGIRLDNKKISSNDISSSVPSRKGRVYITNGLVNKMIPESQLINYENDGYWRGVTSFKPKKKSSYGTLGKIWIHRVTESGVQSKMINSSDLYDFLNRNEGWSRGKGRISRIKK